MSRRQPAVRAREAGVRHATSAWVFLIGVLGLLWSPVVRASATEDLILGPVSMMRVLSRGDTLRVTVTVVLQDTSVLWANRMWGGGEEDRLTRHVGTIEVTRHGKQVWIPLSAYADLGQPRTLDFLSVTQGLGFVIRGGETGTGYEARFYLKKGALSRRRVELGELRDDVWEETRYSPPPGPE